MNVVKKMLIVLGIISGFLFISDIFDESFVLDVTVKIIPTFCLMLYLLLSKLSKRNVFVFIGILFSMIGDFFMEFDDTMLLIGILTNLLGLLSYLFYFITLCKEPKPLLIFPVLIIVIAFYSILFENLGGLKIPVFLYSTCFVLLIWRANVAKDSIQNIVGVFLFWSAILLITSDALLSLRLFNIIDKTPFRADLIMIFWWGGLFGFSIFSVKEKELYEKNSSPCRTA